MVLPIATFLYKQSAYRPATHNLGSCWQTSFAKLHESVTVGLELTFQSCKYFLCSLTLWHYLTKLLLLVLVSIHKLQSSSVSTMVCVHNGYFEFMLISLWITYWPYCNRNKLCETFSRHEKTLPDPPENHRVIKQQLHYYVSRPNKCSVVQNLSQRRILFPCF